MDKQQREQLKAAFFLLAISLGLIILIFCGGCMMHSINDGWRQQVLKEATFDTGCNRLALVDEMHTSKYARYRLSGCNKTHVYKCKNVPSASFDPIIMGPHTIEADCEEAR